MIRHSEGFLRKVKMVIEEEKKNWDTTSLRPRNKNRRGSTALGAFRRGGERDRVTAGEKEKDSKRSVENWEAPALDDTEPKTRTEEVKPREGKG